MPGVVVPALVTLMLLSGVAAAQEPLLTGADFARASGDVKVAHLRRLGVHESQVEPKALAATLRIASADLNAAVRAGAMEALAVRAGSAPPRKGPSTDARTRSWQRVRTELLGLRSTVVDLLRDSGPDVRYRAVSALQALDFDGTGVLGQKLNPETVRTLGRRYAVEAAVRVRLLMVTVLRGTATSVPESHQFLRAAVRDSSAQIRHSALLGLMEVGPPAALSSAVAALGDQDTTVRKQASIAIVQAGPAAKPYVPAIEAALEKGEADATIRQNLTTVLSGLK